MNQCNLFLLLSNSSFLKGQTFLGSVITKLNNIIHDYFDCSTPQISFASVHCVCNLTLCCQLHLYMWIIRYSGMTTTCKFQSVTGKERLQGVRSSWLFFLGIFSSSRKQNIWSPHPCILLSLITISHGLYISRAVIKFKLFFYNESKLTEIIML